MVRNPPAGPHAEVAERFAFLMEAVGLDRDGIVAALDGAISARSLYSVLSGDRRPSRALAVLIERTFGFRADHLLDGSGPMWARGRSGGDDPVARLTDAEARIIEFARESVDNARLLEEELARAQIWASMWQRAMRLLTALEHTAHQVDARRYAESATAVLEECWRMAEAFGAWSDAKDRRRVVHLTRLFVRRFLVDVPAELTKRDAMSASESAAVSERSRALLARLDQDAQDVDGQVGDAEMAVQELSSATWSPEEGDDLAGRLDVLMARIDRNRDTYLG